MSKNPNVEFSGSDKAELEKWEKRYAELGGDEAYDAAGGYERYRDLVRQHLQYMKQQGATE